MIRETLTGFATDHPRTVYVLVLAMTLAAGAFVPRIHIDTDPENMLSAEQPDRLFHDAVERRFVLHDAIVVGVVNETNANGIYNPQSLAALHSLGRSILGLEGVIRPDLMSLAESDNISQEGPGTIRFEWLMKEAPTTVEQAREVRDKVQRLPLLLDTLVSGDSKAAAIYVPIKSKDLSYRLAGDIRRLIAELPGDDTWHITGLPVAEDTFGHDMFVQMGISAPLAGLMIFLLMLFFFRSGTLVIAPMLVAMATVIVTIGLLIGFGFTVHIMSSMIPIFLMPIAVVDSVHIMSEFADSYRPGADVKDTITGVLRQLFTPMLFTSLTSAIGFASLLLTPIPPVQIFGAFVAFGILLAYVLTILLIPAYVVRMRPAALEKIRQRAGKGPVDSLLARMLRATGRFSAGHGKAITGLAVAFVAVSVGGVFHIRINDNPVRWFKANHPIRVADRALNAHFAGTYDAFLVLSADTSGVLQRFRDTSDAALVELGGKAPATVREALHADAADANAWFDDVIATIDDALLGAGDPGVSDVLEDLIARAESAQSDARPFQRPKLLQQIEDLQRALNESGDVGKTNALPDVVKVVNRELRGGDAADYRIPNTPEAVAQTLLQYQSSHRPQDLWHMVTPDFSSAAVWLQLRSGDNQDMTRVLEVADTYLAAHPLPEGIEARWAGKTYINVVWQDAMVKGMLYSLAGAFLTVFAMMSLLFRSLRLGVLAMVPLSVTIVGVYGFIGWIGKDYDMPIAVLSSLTLGLSVDFAIHFIERCRVLLAQTGSHANAMRALFEEPARAIARNAIVIAVGFTPLFFAPLVPYITVGAFMAAIMALSGVTTLVLLPAILAWAKRWFFPDAQGEDPATAEGPHKPQGACLMKKSVFAVLLTIAAATTHAADTMTDAGAIVEKANQAAYYAGDDGRSEVRMIIIDGQGRQQRRQFTVLRRNTAEGADQQFLVVFSRPADVRGTAFLVHKHVDRDDDRWLYLPGLDLVKRISAGDKRTSFVGAHYFYEDVSGRRPSDDTHELVETTDKYYVLEHTPVHAASVEFANYVTWIDRETFLPIKIEYRNASGEIYRRVEALDVENVDGHPTVTTSRVSDLDSGGRTDMQFRHISYDLGIPADVFTERALRTPPREWLDRASN